MHILSTFFRIAVQVLIVVAVPGGLPAVIIYQYRRYQKRRAAKNSPILSPLSSPNEQPLPQSHP